MFTLSNITNQIHHRTYHFATLTPISAVTVLFPSTQPPTKGTVPLMLPDL